MTDIPTTENGPLHTPDSTFDDRLIQATFETSGDAQIARERLIEGGIAADRVSVINNAADSADVQAAVQPDDQNWFGRLREKILPDDSSSATTKAAAHHEAILELRPTKEEVDLAVKIIEDSKPTRFDARLERWRNTS